MKVVLIFPPQSLQERYSHDVGNVGGFLPPLGLCYMAAVLERDGHNVKLMDCPANSYTKLDIINYIREFKPDVIGIAAITSLADITKELCSIIRQIDPKITIVLGGPHPTIMPQEVSKEMDADIIIVEEADNIICDVLKDLEKYKTQRIVNAGKVKDLDTIPLPALHLLDMSKYSSLPNTYKTSPKTFQMVTSRGCPYTCTFCNDALGKFRQRSVENVINEIQHWKKIYNIKEIAFWDDILTLNKAWMYKFCEAIGKENIVWSCYTRLDLVDEPLLRAMKKAGCWNIFFGIESGDDQLLKNITKRMTVEEMKKQVRVVQKVGIVIRGSFMLGLPGETPELGRKTIQYAIELEPDYTQFSITTPYPGTQLWKDYEKWGTLDKNFKEYHGWRPVFLPYGYKSRDELLAIHKEAFKKFYMRPKYIMKRIAKMRSLNDIKRNISGLRMIKGFA